MKDAPPMAELITLLIKLDEKAPNSSMTWTSMTADGHPGWLTQDDEQWRSMSKSKYASWS